MKSLQIESVSLGRWINRFCFEGDIEITQSGITGQVWISWLAIVAVILFIFALILCVLLFQSWRKQRRLRKAVKN